MRDEGWTTTSSLIPHPSSLASFFLFHVVGDAEAGAGGGVHLLGGVDGVLQFGDSFLDLGEFFFDLVLQIVDLLFRLLENPLVELTLLIAQDRHRWHTLRTLGWPKRGGL